jgi:hypothetical protein
MPSVIARVLAIVLTVFIGLLSLAQSPYRLPVFTPTAPTSRDEITALLQTPGICIAEDGGTLLVGSVVRTDVLLGDCVIGAPSFLVDTPVTFGPLPVGTYTYVVYHDWQLGSGPELVSTQNLMVLPAAEPIPTLTSPAQIAMILLMACVGGLFLSRRCV